LSEGKRVMDEMSREGEMSHGGPGDRASAATEQSGEQTHNARRDRSEPLLGYANIGDPFI